MTEAEKVVAEAALAQLRSHLRVYRRSSGLDRMWARSHVMLWLGVCKHYRDRQRAIQEAAQWA